MSPKYNSKLLCDSVCLNIVTSLRDILYSLCLCIVNDEIQVTHSNTNKISSRNYASLHLTPYQGVISRANFNEIVKYPYLAGYIRTMAFIRIPCGFYPDPAGSIRTLWVRVFIRQTDA